MIEEEFTEFSNMILTYIVFTLIGFTILAFVRKVCGFKKL